MGSPEGQGSGDERPRHPVTITRPFWLGVHQVTQGQWQQVLGTTPWKGQPFSIEGSDVAASYVSWDAAVEFCERLSQKEGRRYRLPTEAEWEYACRAGTTRAYSFGDDKKQLGEYAWFDGNADLKGQAYAHRVGQKRPNGFGLSDVHGNVWEWCSDWYDEEYYAKSATSDPAGPPSGFSAFCGAARGTTFPSVCVPRTVTASPLTTVTSSLVVECCWSVVSFPRHPHAIRTLHLCDSVL